MPEARPPKPIRTLADFLRKVREQRGQSKRSAADQCGVSSTTWIHWERGQMPRADALFRVADWSGCNVDDLRQVIENSL